MKTYVCVSALLAQLDAHSTGDQGVVGSTLPGRQHSFMEIGHEIFSMVILSPLIQEGQLSVFGKRMSTILVNCLGDLTCLAKVWLGKLTMLDMTPLG